MRRIMFGLTIALLVNSLSSAQIVSAESRQCAIVQSEAKKIFDGKYKSETGALVELAKRTTKAMVMVLQNQECITAKDYKEVQTSIKEIKKSCDDAKKDALAWGIMKGMCSAYAPLWKYAK